MQSVFLLVAVLALTVYGQLTIKSRALVPALAGKGWQDKPRYVAMGLIVAGVMPSAPLR